MGTVPNFRLLSASSAAAGRGRGSRIRRGREGLRAGGPSHPRAVLPSLPFGEAARGGPRPGLLRELRRRAPPSADLAEGPGDAGERADASPGGAPAGRRRADPPPGVGPGVPDDRSAGARRRSGAGGPAAALERRVYVY